MAERWLVGLGGLVFGSYCIWRGWVTTWTLATPPLEWMFRVSVSAARKMGGEEAARRRAAKMWNPRWIRLYGLAWLVGGIGVAVQACLVLAGY